MNTATLSVVMANYNHAKYIEEALKAILSQSYKPLEVIVVDDGSTDDSVNVIQRFVKKDPVVRLIINEKNMGIFYNANRSLKLAKGDYITFAAADDKVLPGFFEKSMKMLAEYPDAGLCCAESAAIDNSTGAIIKRTIDIASGPSYFSPSMAAELMRNTSFYIEGRAAVIKRELLIENGSLNPDLKLYSDWLLWLLIAFRHGICYIPETLTVFRALPDSYFASELRDEASRYDVIKRLLFMLKSEEYKDVLFLFRRSCVLNDIFLEGVLSVIMRNPKLWNFLSSSAIRKSLSYNVLNNLSMFFPPLVKNIYRNARNKKMKSYTKRIVKKADLA